MTSPSAKNSQRTGKWQRLILDTLKRHKSFRLQDLLSQPYSLSDYNALTRACRTLVSQGKIGVFSRDGYLIVTLEIEDYYKFAFDEFYVPESLSKDEKVKSKKLGVAEQIAFEHHCHPRTIFRSVSFVSVVDYVAAALGISGDNLVNSKKLSSAVIHYVYVLLLVCPEIREHVVEVAKEILQGKDRVCRTKAFNRRLIEHVD